MSIPNIIIILIFLLLCSNSSCLLNPPCNNPNSDDLCACSGYDPVCEFDTGFTGLDFPNGTYFVVQNIDYQARVIRLRDRRKCLAKKVMQLNLTSTPFQYNNVYNQYYNLYKCLDIKNIDRNVVVHKIDCLSTMGYTVVAAPLNYSTSKCDRLGDGPVVLPVDYERDQEPSYLILTWSDDTCMPFLTCPGDYGSYSPNTHRKVALPTAIALGLMVPIMVCVLWCIAVIVKKKGRSSRAANDIVATTAQRLPTLSTIRNVDDVVVATGLDQATLDSYPVVVIGESGRFLKAAGQEQICSICLSDYHPNDTLKILPECLHKFHVHCIDEWLRAKDLCPICRTTPPRTIS